MKPSLRETVFDVIREWWDRVAAEPDDHKIMGKPPDDITIFEFTSLDESRENCTGDVTAIETRDRRSHVGPAVFSHPRDVIAGKRIRGAYWEHAQARFYVSGAENIAVLEVVFGPRYGRGYKFVRAADGSIKQLPTWVS